MSRTPCPFLRPVLARGFRPVTKPEHARVYLAFRRWFAKKDLVERPVLHSPNLENEKNQRLQQLERVAPLGTYHPRLTREPDAKVLSPKVFRKEFNHITGLREDVKVQVFGRASSVRTAGQKLLFVDFARDEHKVQSWNDFGYLEKRGVDMETLNKFKSIVRKGDWVSVTGHPARTSSNELSIKTTELPVILSPSLHHIPRKILDPETIAVRPHVHQLVEHSRGDILRLRSFIYKELRHHLDRDGFTEVETPTFDVGAGGAIARPFTTVANSISDEILKLRVAPELYLKRLIVAGHDKVYEVARVFRNEGIDNTHNPEFTICEFYEVGATLEDLMSRTETLFRELAAAIQASKGSLFPSIPDFDVDLTKPFARIPFIPTIEKGMNCKLPDLSAPDSLDELIKLFDSYKFRIPSQPTVPRMLDRLAAMYIEPLCEEPSFIINHPEAMSPLSKSYICPETKQRIAARAEFFIQGREYVNAYEEENSPFEQLRKFEEQARLNKADGTDTVIDKSYVEALEWGMPPTGGWGCGLDRLVMLFGGKRRIADVLPFGTLRNAVTMGKVRQEEFRESKR